MTNNPYLLPGLTTPRLRFRLLDEQDFLRALAFFEHPESHRYWQTEGKSPHTLCSEWFAKQQWRYANGKGGAMALTLVSDNSFVGWCGLLVQEVDGQQELEVGYSMLPDHWGHGYATEAALACLEFAFERHLASSVISIIQVNNTPSIRVAEKNGMRIDRQTTYHGNPVYIYRVAPK